MADIDYIKLRPDRIGWTLIVYTEEGVTEYGLGDVIQFTEEVDRTLGKWLADGPADFHAGNGEHDDAAIARTVRERDAADTGERLTIEELADELNIELDEEDH